MNSFKKEKVLITGAAGGIGKELSKIFAKSSTINTLVIVDYSEKSCLL